MSKMIIVEGNSNDKDNVRTFMVKGEKGEPGDVNMAQLNETKDILQSQINSLASGNPLVASSTSEMTDTSKIYVNTSDGYWYYYNGTQWTQGDIYQSSGINDGAISFLNLDYDLQSNFLDNYSEPVDLGNSYTGYYQNDGTLISNSSFINYHYNLQNGKTYLFTGNNVSQSNALIIMDNNDNVIYASNPTNTSAVINKKFKCNQNNLIAYISKQIYTGSQDRLTERIDGKMRILTNIFNQLKYSISIPTYQTITDKFTVSGNNPIRFGVASGYNVKIYQATKGRNYLIKGYDRASVCCCAITDLNGTIIYTSNDEDLGSQVWREFEKNYMCAEDGFIIITEFQDSTHEKATIEIINYGIEIDEPIENKLKNKKLGADGDSIMAGDGNNNKSYADIIATNNTMTLNKIAVGGGTIASGTYSGENPRHWICESVLNLDNDCDFILINGGINDWNNSVPIGSITNGYDTTLNSTTFYGGLETLCRNLLSKFNGNTKIYFVTNHNVHNIYNTPKSGVNFSVYLNAIYEVMSKYGIEVIDIGKNTHLNTGITYYANNYTANGDGIHPTENGYNLFYVDYITKILKY